MTDALVQTMKAMKEGEYFDFPLCSMKLNSARQRVAHAAKIAGIKTKWKQFLKPVDEKGNPVYRVWRVNKINKNKQMGKLNKTKTFVIKNDIPIPNGRISEEHNALVQTMKAMKEGEYFDYPLGHMELKLVRKRVAHAAKKAGIKTMSRQNLNPVDEKGNPVYRVWHNGLK